MTHKTAKQLIAEAKDQVSEISVDQLKSLDLAEDKVVLVDVREQNEWNLGHIPGAIHIGRGILESNIEQRVDRERRVVLYCQSGNRSALAGVTLKAMGYNSVESLAGGWKQWTESGGDIAD